MTSAGGARAPRPRVLVLAGGLSPEREVSLTSGTRVADALRDNGFDVELADADASLVERIAEARDVIAFPLLHGAEGEDGALRSVLELHGMPYVGSRPGPCRLAFDKPAAKAIVERAGLLTPMSVALPHAAFRELGAPRVLDAVVARLGLPVVVKPARGGSALGVRVVAGRDDLPAAVAAALAYDDVVLLEQHVRGTEVAVSVLETDGGGDGRAPASAPLALPAVEIDAPPGGYDYAARYTPGLTTFHAPARLSGDRTAVVAEAATTAHQALGLRHLSRTDLVVDDGGRAWFLEVNVAPGMTGTSLLPTAVAAAGLTLGGVCADLVAAAAPGPPGS